MKNFNINQYVGVKLTEEGLKILETEHNEILRSIPPKAAESLGPFVAPPVDEEGYSQIQFWQLMYYFGKHMYNGNPNIPFDMDIKIADEDLIEHTSNKSRGI